MFPVRLVDICRFFKASELNVWKLVSIKSVVHKIVQTFSQRVKHQTNKFFVLDEHSHIQYMDYLKKLCMCPVRLDFCKASELNVWKLVSITLNFVRIKSVAHKLCRPFRSELNPNYQIFGIRWTLTY